MALRVLLNGKKAVLASVRAAIYKAREHGPVDVRVTWESGDVRRLVREACADGCQRLVAGGGDGTVNEIVNALMGLADEDRPELAILPLGTANDFATGCGIQSDLDRALDLARQGSACKVDVVKANASHFINVASGGFGAEVTANTPLALKNLLGGGAYTLAGVVRVINFVAYVGEFRIPGEVTHNEIVVGAVCNGRQAGGGQQLAPAASINDGLLDIVALHTFPARSISQVIEELRNPDPDARGEYVRRYKVPWAEWESATAMPINLDGEPMKVKAIRFEVVPEAIKLVVPEHCPLVSGRQS